MRPDSALESPARFACTAARVFDGVRTVTDHAVVVESGVVSGVVPCESLPGGLPVWNEPDCTIVPGLIDTHTHFMRWQGPYYLAHGVTTIRDTGNDLRWILARREEAESRPWPRILCMGPVLDGPVPVHEFVSRRCADGAAAVTAVREVAAAGVDGIKFYVGLDPQWLPDMARETHSGGCRASLHCFRGVIAAGRAGVDEFFHLDGILAEVWPEHPAGWLEVWGLSEFSGRWSRQCEVADAIRETGIAATPTLAYWDSQWRARTPEYARSEALRGVPPDIIRWQASEVPNPAASLQWRRALEAAQRFVGLLVERGVPVLAGTDVPCGAVPPGSSLWKELSLLVGAGMSAEQALRAATSDAAAFLGHPELGQLSRGSAADMVFVRGHPADRIPEEPDIPLVVCHGVGYRPRDLLAEAGVDGRGQPEPWALQFEAHWARRPPPRAPLP